MTVRPDGSKRTGARVYYPKCRALLQIIFDGFGPQGTDSKPYQFPVRPVSAVIHRNSYRQADSWEMTFIADDFPIDPALIRSGAVEIYMYQTADLQDTLRTRSSRQIPSEESTAQEKDLDTQKGAGEFAKPQIAGLIDDARVEYSTAQRLVTLQGQDYTAFLIGKQWPPLSNGRPRRIPTGKRIDKLMRQWIGAADPTGRLQLSVEGLKASELPVVGAKEVRNNRRGIPTKTETSYWDVIYGTAIRHGLICFVRGLDVVLTKPQNFSEQYRGRPLLLTWGRNIERLEMSRKLGKEKVPQIIVQAYDSKRKRNIVVKYPKKVQEVPLGTIGVNKDEYRIVPWTGPPDRSLMRDAAEGLFNLLGRAERTVVLSTRDLRDLDNVDILDAVAGTPVIVDFDEFNLNESLLADKKVPTDRKYAHLRHKGYGEEISRVIATNYLNLRALKRPMRIREISFTYSVEDGISIEAELVDYVVIGGERETENKTSSETRKERRFTRSDGTSLGGD